MGQTKISKRRGSICACEGAPLVSEPVITHSLKLLNRPSQSGTVPPYRALRHQGQRWTHPDFDMFPSPPPVHAPQLFLIRSRYEQTAHVYPPADSTARACGALENPHRRNMKIFREIAFGQEAIPLNHTSFARQIPYPLCIRSPCDNVIRVCSRPFPHNAS